MVGVCVCTHCVYYTLCSQSNRCSTTSSLSVNISGLHAMINTILSEYDSAFDSESFNMTQCSAPKLFRSRLSLIWSAACRTFRLHIHLHHCMCQIFLQTKPVSPLRWWDGRLIKPRLARSQKFALRLQLFRLDMNKQTNERETGKMFEIVRGVRET